MKCKVRITQNGKYPIAHATVVLFQVNNKKEETELDKMQSGEDGNCLFEHLAEGDYLVRSKHFGAAHEKTVHIHPDQDAEASLDFDLDLKLTFKVEGKQKLEECKVAIGGRRLLVEAESNFQQHIESYRWVLDPTIPFVARTNEIELVVPVGVDHIDAEVLATEKKAEGPAATIRAAEGVAVRAAEVTAIGGTVDGRMSIRESVGVRLLRTASDPTLDQALWVAIRNRTRAISFDRYQQFMNRALLWEEGSDDLPVKLENRADQERVRRELSDLGTHLHGVRAYQTLKLLTETFLLLECGVRIDPRRDRDRAPFDPYEEARRLGRPFSFEEMEQRLRDYLGDGRKELPYIARVVKTAFPEMERGDWGGRLITARINEPCMLELIWSYWMEEGMLVQTINALSQRFQNIRSNGDRDPLANIEIDPLRPLNNLFWGFIQDEVHRLTVRRRAHEYANQYGVTLYGKAASGLNPADTRSKFLEAFHNLLYQSSLFFRDDFQTTVIADGFPLLNSLKEVHLILAQGAHNQFGDLPWTARVEMLLMQFILARREVRDFLQSRAMVPYKEPWQAQVDSMKTLQGWNDTTVTFFGDLATYGEQLLLSIRYGDWIGVNDEDSAKNWARYFRPEIQGYLHAYRAATGVDLTNPDTVDATIPGVYLQKRTAVQRAR